MVVELEKKEKRKDKNTERIKFPFKIPREGNLWKKKGGKTLVYIKIAFATTAPIAISWSIYVHMLFGLESSGKDSVLPGIVYPFAGL